MRIFSSRQNEGALKKNEMLFLNKKTSIRKAKMFNISSNCSSSSSIDFTLLPKNCPSLCIPRVFANIGEARIRKIFENISIGCIEKIEIIKREKGNCVFIHLVWNNTSDALYVRNQVMTGKNVKVIYDEPWFWMVSASRKPPCLNNQTDEFGRELRQQPPPPPPPMPRPPLPPMPMPYQERRQEPRRPQYQERRQEPRRSQYQYQENPPRSAQLQRQDAHYDQFPTDEFGREIRRHAPPPPPPPPAQKQYPKKTVDKEKSWADADDNDSDDEDQQFIPTSPTTTPPSLRHKQIQEAKEEDKKTPITTSFDVDKPRTSDKIEIKYELVIPVPKIRKSKK